MNRRSILKLLGVAPVAVPAAATSLAQTSPLTNGGYIGRLAEGSALIGEGFGGAYTIPPSLVRELEARVFSKNKLISQEIAITFARQTSVEDQMREHDLFADLGCPFEGGE